jgi:hypothetical protein
MHHSGPGIAYVSFAHPPLFSCHHTSLAPVTQPFSGYTTTTLIVDSLTHQSPMYIKEIETHYCSSIINPNNVRVKLSRHGTTDRQTVSRGDNLYQTISPVYFPNFSRPPLQNLLWSTAEYDHPIQSQSSLTNVIFY